MRETAKSEGERVDNKQGGRSKTVMGRTKGVENRQVREVLMAKERGGDRPAGWCANVRSCEGDRNEREKWM